MRTNPKQATPQGDPKHRREPIHPDDVESVVEQAPGSGTRPRLEKKPGSVTNERPDDAQPQSSTEPLAEKKPGSSA